MVFGWKKIFVFIPKIPQTFNLPIIGYNPENITLSSVSKKIDVATFIFKETEKNFN